MPHFSGDPGHWLFWPDYSASNPFQLMVYRAFPPGWRVAHGDLAAALARQSEGGRVVFHLHWEDAVYRAARDIAAANSLVGDFLARLDTFLASGGTFVWTVHNEQPHEAAYVETDAGLRRALAARAHVVHMHGHVAAECMAPPLGLAPLSVLVTPLGGFSGHYPDDIGQTAARRYFDIAPDAPVFATLGAMRAYKGIDLLLEAFRAVQARVPSARLLLAGRANANTTARYVSAGPGILALPQYIDDATVQYVLRAADFAVFAFRKVMVSSSVLLAQTFGLPAIVPDLPALREMIEPGRNGFVYPVGDAAGLARMMLGCVALPADSRAGLTAAALAEIARRDWGDYTRALVNAAEATMLARAA